MQLPQFGITMRSKSFQQFIDYQIESLERWKTRGNDNFYEYKLTNYVIDIDDETETIRIDIAFVPTTPIPYITLDFVAVSSNVSFDEVVAKKKDSE